MKKRRRSLQGRRSLQRGQAMVEYSLIVHALFFLSAAIAWPFFTVFMNALNTYYEALFQVLTAPLP